MAPVFDLICTEAYPELESGMALRLDGIAAWPDAKRLERFGVRHCQLEPSETRAFVLRACEAVIECLPLLSDPRMPPATAKVMRLAVELGVASLRGGI